MPRHRGAPAGRSLVTSIALFMVTLDNLVVSTALPSIRVDLGASLESLEWTVNAYTLAFAVLLLTGAALGDRFGRRRMFVDRRRAVHASPARPPRSRRRSSALVAARAIQGVGAAIVAAAHADAALRGRPAEQARRWRSAPGPGSPASASRSARSSAARSSTASRGTGSSGSTSRSASSLVPLPSRVLTESAAPRGAGPARARRSPAPACSASSSGSSAARRWAGPRRRSSARSAPASCCSPRFLAWERRAPAPMLPLRFFRSRAFSATNGVVVRDVLRRLRLDLPALAVLPDRAGLLAAAVRAARCCRGRSCRCSSRRSPASSATGSARGR